MNILIEVRHPAHVHHFFPIIDHCIKRGFELLIVATQKDITTKLLDEYGVKYTLYGQSEKGIVSKLLALLKQDIKLFKIAKEFKPDLFVGRPSHPLTFISRLMRKPSLIFAEDDVKEVFLNAMLAHPFADVIVSPISTDLSIFEHKKIQYVGTQKLAYINHKTSFDSDEVIKRYGLKKPYLVLRSSSLSAGHDINAKGLSGEIIERLHVDLAPKGNVYISAEGELPEKLKPMRLGVKSTDIYAVLKSAECFISDSQSMTIECSLLGVPNVRYSSFVGKLNAFNDFEKLDLTRSVHTSKPYEELLKEIESLLGEINLKDRLQGALSEYYADKTDLTRFSIYMIDQLSKTANKRSLLKSWVVSDKYKKFGFSLP